MNDISILPVNCFNNLSVCRHGPMLYNRNDQYIGKSLEKYGEYCPGESEIFRTFITPGSTVIEVGSNIGAHTIELSKLASPGGVVHAFEPQRILFQTLCGNLMLNGRANVYTYQEAVGAIPGQIIVPFLSPSVPNNFGGLSLIGARYGDSLPLRTIDSLAVTECHFLKIDCEGMEIEVLQGAANTIKAHRPILYVENDRKERAEELTDLIFSYDYKLYWHWPPLFEKDNFNNDSENIFQNNSENIVSINMICIPAELNLPKALRYINVLS